MSVEIADEQDVHIDHDRLKSRLSEALAKAGVPELELSILLADDDRMTDLNRTYRHVSSTTDVLSFPQDHGDFPAFGDVLGDIVISVPTASRQAKAVGITLEEELENLAFHGLLHLLDHDHETEGWAEWNRALKEILPDE